MNIIIALGSFLVGTLFGIVLMCCIAVNKKERDYE